MLRGMCTVADTTLVMLSNATIEAVNPSIYKKKST
jgi:hypothetical protein